jgi:phospholipid/cholesterol/gamma-HCH transport system ATP-binding protein
MIEGRDLMVSFGGRAAIKDLSFQAVRGELVGLVGAAASGKTVLLKTLCLLYRPDRGDVIVEGVSLAQASVTMIASVRAKLGFCFQNLALFDNLDAAGNVAFALLRRGVPSKEAHERALDQLKAVGLAAAATKLPHELSGGMKRRLALARAMVSRPEVGLYDDPFVGLDPVACSRIARLIARSHAENGGTTIVAAGDPSPLFAVADRLVLLERGRVMANLPAREFRSENNPSVARYLNGVGRAA